MIFTSIFFRCLALFSLLIITQNSFAQNWNPPFPRIGQITFYNPGMGAKIWEKHDLIIIRHKFSDAAREIKKKKS